MAVHEKGAEHKETWTGLEEPLGEMVVPVSLGAFDCVLVCVVFGDRLVREQCICFGKAEHILPDYQGWQIAGTREIKGTGMNVRASTYVDRGSARVGNRWFTREWSAFLGNTVSLLDQAGDFEWMNGRSNEFELEVDGATLTMMDFAEVSWSEENNPAGATLVARQIASSLEFRIRTLAFHSNPGLVRFVAVANTGDRPVRVDRAIVEMLPIRASDAEVVELAWSVDGVGRDGWYPADRAVVLRYYARGLVLGFEARAVVARAGGEGPWQVEAPGPIEVAPGKAHTFPVSFLLPYTGEFGDYARRTYAECVQLVRRVQEGSLP